MDINIIHILILLFIFYPLIKGLFDKLAGKEEAEEAQNADAEDIWHTEKEPWHTEDKKQPQTQQAERKKPESWEEFFEGLEDVLAGKEPESQPSKAAETEPVSSQASHSHPLEGPVYDKNDSRRPASSTTKDRDFGPASSYRKSMSARSSQYEDYDGPSLADQVDKELTESDNPIYLDLDDSPQVVVVSQKGRKNVKRILSNPEKLRDGILLKEILDPPKSRRQFHSH